MAYVDGFVLVVPKRRMKDYRKMARLAGKVWMEKGALQYMECVGDDLKSPFGLPFPKLAKLKGGEAVRFSWSVYGSKAQRNRINKAVMADPRIKKMMEPGNMPMDDKRMAFGGFKAIVEMQDA